MLSNDLGAMGSNLAGAEIGVSVTSVAFVLEPNIVSKTRAIRG